MPGRIDDWRSDMDLVIVFVLEMGMMDDLAFRAAARLYDLSYMKDGPFHQLSPEGA